LDEELWATTVVGNNVRFWHSDELTEIEKV
jgi:hypothetical protein